MSSAATERPTAGLGQQINEQQGDNDYQDSEAREQEAEGERIQTYLLAIRHGDGGEWVAFQI